MDKKIFLVWGGTLLAILFLFQNCADDVDFAAGPADTASLNTGNNTSDNPGGGGGPGGEEPPNVVCNPLDPSEPCYEGGGGLMGDLYYLTPEIHEDDFNGDLNTAMLDDYPAEGIRVPVNIVMSSVNITPRDWQSGFILPSGEQVTKESGEKLFEWFYINMSGFISLPAGSYQFATRSDDGMRVTVNNEEIINADGVHAPRYDCANQIIDFADGEKKHLRVQYFQGPRHQISMQLLVRPASQQGQSCNENHGLMPIAPEAYSKN